MKNQHIQKQIIEEFRKKFGNLTEKYDSGSYIQMTMVATEDIEAFLKTSLEKIWKDADKETLEKIENEKKIQQAEGHCSGCTACGRGSCRIVHKKTRGIYHCDFKQTT